MGVTFHMLTSTAIAATAASRVRLRLHRTWLTNGWASLLIIFVVCIVSHGILDILPHQYALPSPLDVGIALLGFTGTICFAKKQTRWLLLMCFVGCLLSDIIDLTLPILNHKLGTAFPTYRLFPWHWPGYSGSIFDGRRTFESHLYRVRSFKDDIDLLLPFWRHFPFSQGKKPSFERGEHHDIVVLK